MWNSEISSVEISNSEIRKIDNTVPVEKLRRFVFKQLPCVREEGIKYIGSDFVTTYYTPLLDGHINGFSCIETNKFTSYAVLTKGQDHDDGITISKTMFAALIGGADNVVSRIRHYFIIGQRKWTISHYIESQKGSFLLGETELFAPSEEFTVPNEASSDVSSLDEYKNEFLGIKLTKSEENA